MNILSRALCGAALLALGCGAANAKVSLSSLNVSISADHATVADKTGGPRKASWDIAPIKGARTAGPATRTVTLAKVSLQDFHRLCPGSMPPEPMTMADGGVMGADDWEAPVCRLATATVDDEGAVYTLSNVSIVHRDLAARCAGNVCGTTDHLFVDLDVTYDHAISEKGTAGTNPPKTAK